MQQTNYGFTKTVDLSYEQAIEPPHKLKYIEK